MAASQGCETDAMSSEKWPPPPPPLVPTTLLALGGDLLRLPSLPSLVRAAFTCRAFLSAVRSSPAFRRNFLTLRPPPLLGFFFDPEGSSIPSFAPIRRRSDRDLAAAVRGADLFLTLLPDDDDASPGWVIADCREGNLLLVNCETGKLTVYNPIKGALDLIPPPPDEMLDDMLQAGLGNGTDLDLDCCILSPEEGGGPPSRLLYSCHDESRTRAAAFSCDTREWHTFPWPQPVTPEFDGDKDWFRLGTMVNGFVYWACADDEAYIVVLNAATPEFSRIRLPSILEGLGYISMVGKTKDGKLCMVFPLEFTLHVWVWGTNADGTESWVFDKKFPLDTVVELTKGTLEEHRQLKVVAIVDGFVYFSTGEPSNYNPSAWFLSLCMETAEVDKLFQKNFDFHVHPYVMSWPLALVDNMVRPQHEGA